MSDTSRSLTPTPDEYRSFSNRRRRTVADYGDSLSNELQNINALYSMDVFRWKDDDICMFLRIFFD